MPFEVKPHEALKSVLAAAVNFFFDQGVVAGLVLPGTLHLKWFSRPLLKVQDPCLAAATSHPVCHIVSSTPSPASKSTSWGQGLRLRWTWQTGGLRARRWRRTRHA